LRVAFPAIERFTIKKRHPFARGGRLLRADSSDERKSGEGKKESHGRIRVGRKPENLRELEGRSDPEMKPAASAYGWWRRALIAPFNNPQNRQIWSGEIPLPRDDFAHAKEDRFAKGTHGNLGEMELLLREIDLPLRHPFTTSHGTMTVQRNLLVELRQDGVSGFGEGAQSRAYPQYSVAAMRETLEAAHTAIEQEQLGDPETLWKRLRPLLARNPFAQCALDEAAHDLWGKLRGAPVWKLWGLELHDLPASDYTIGLDAADKMVAKMREFNGWPIYKIKLGGPDDMAIMRELRRHTDAVFRIDANTGWTAEQTIAYAPELKTLGVEFLEQPLPADDWAGMERVRRECALPVVADESCQSEADVERCARYFHGINIKLTKAGGLTPARRMAQRARELGLGVMAGCMNESSVGISALAQLLPLLDAVDMDGSLLIARDVATGVWLDKGRAIFPDENGTGVKMLDH
jgi:L-alanine-DL-glutamate epimerase-like enolase superfamily enzyme